MAVEIKTIVSLCGPACASFPPTSTRHASLQSRCSSAGPCTSNRNLQRIHKECIPFPSEQDNQAFLPLQAGNSCLGFSRGLRVSRPSYISVARKECVQKQRRFLCRNASRRGSDELRGRNVPSEAVESDEDADKGQAGEERRAEKVKLPLGYELTVPTVTVYKVVKWIALCALAVAGLNLSGAALSLVIFNPSLWMYVSWFFVAWPWPTAVFLGVFPLWRVLTSKQRGKPTELWEQLLTLCGALVWLVLAPSAIFNGYIGFWPAFLFSFYFLFFTVGAIVRMRLYGSLAAREKDEQWKTPSSRVAQVSFIATVVAGHWLAAKESSMAVRSSLSLNIVALVILASALTLHWQATFFLGKYFDRLVVPQRVVIFGPYRFVRHPIYGSYMLLFIGYSLALRAPMSAVLLLLASFLYYELRTRLEETLLLRNFKSEYQEYKMKTPKKYFPLLL